MRVKTLQELADAGKLSGKRVLIRSDLNAPHDESGRITDETRLTASVPAIQMALRAGAAVMVVSHLGRPKEGVPTEAESLIHVADRLSELLGTEMPLVRNWVDGVTVEPGSRCDARKTAASMSAKRRTTKTSPASTRRSAMST